MEKLPLVDPEKLNSTMTFGWASLGLIALLILRCLLGVP